MPTISLFLFALLLALPTPRVMAKDVLSPKLKKHIQRGAVTLSQPGKDPFFTYGQGNFVPASILKIGTCLAAMEAFGPNHRFTTKVELDEKGNLKVEGRGDPSLVSESLQKMAQELKKRHFFARPLERVFLEEGYFSNHQNIDGRGRSLNPYDAAPGALVVNFNTLSLKVDKQGNIESGENQTPLTPTARKIGQALAPGKHRINLSRQEIQNKTYRQELFEAFFEAEGATFSTTSPARTEKKTYLHPSLYNLEETCKQMLHYSNNFIANQLTIALGKGQRKLGIKAGAKELEAFLLQKTQLKSSHILLKEGSGLSRKNQLSPLAMARILEAFRPYKSLLRAYPKKNKIVLAKTGTLKKVYSLAGFLPDYGQGRWGFVILLEQRKDNRQRLLSLLQQQAKACAEKKTVFCPQT